MPRPCIPLNIAGGNGKFAVKGRLLGFARGSVLECAAYLDVLLPKGLTDTKKGRRTGTYLLSGE